MKTSTISKTIAIFLVVFILCVFAFALSSAKISYAENATTAFDDLINEIANARDFEETVILIDDIALPQNKPVAINITNKNIIIKSSKDHSVISSNTLGCIMILATKVDNTSYITFENIKFRTQNADVLYSPDGDYSTTMQYAFGFTQGNIDATFSNCSFEGYQYGKGSGACISAVYSRESVLDQSLNLTFENCLFRNNVSATGAIYLSGNRNKNNISATFSNSTFEHNIGARSGAIFSDGATVDIVNSTFKDCEDYTAYVLKSGFSRNGAIYAQNSILTVDKCNIMNNEHIDGSAIAIVNSKATVQNSTVYNNTATNGSIIHVTNSPYHLVAFINNTIKGNRSSDNKHFKVDKKEDDEHTLPQEIKTKILFNTFYSNAGKSQNILDDERVSTFANLFVDDELNETIKPSETNDFNAFVDVNTFKTLSADNPADNAQLRLNNAEFALDNAIIKDEVSFLYNSVYGTFYVGSNSYDKITLFVKTGRHTDALYFDDIQSIKISPKNRFGYDFNAYLNYADLSSALISYDTRNEVIKTSYSLNDEGVGVFIVLPIAIVLTVVVAVVIFVAIKKKKSVVNTSNTSSDVCIEQEQPQTTNSTSWIDIAVGKTIVKEKLSEREMDVFVKLLEGKSRKTCADELFITESTVKKHSASIYKKFEVKNRAELVNKINNI